MQADVSSGTSGMQRLISTPKPNATCGSSTPTRASILSRLPAAIGALRSTSTAFLTGYGDATGDQWRAFGAIVERTITREVDEALTVAGARDTFSRLIDWLAVHEYRTELPVRGIA